VTVLYSVVINSIVKQELRLVLMPICVLKLRWDLAAVWEFCGEKYAGFKTNVAHLSYLGDATLGDRVIGAGTITANYDGVRNIPTQIGDRTKTGSNSVLVAPVKLGADVCWSCYRRCTG